MRHEQESNGSAADLTCLLANETLLRSEIAFWQDMIESCDADHPADGVERMRQALGLAEYRLMQLYQAVRSV